MAQTARQKARDRALARREAPVDYWRSTARRMPVGADRWRLTALRGKGSTPLNVSPITVGFDWADASAILEGTLTLELPPRRVDISEGHVIVCEHARAGAFHEIWRMRVSSPQVTASSRGFELTLADDMKLLQRSKDDFDYRKGKHKPQGWWAHEIIADIAHRYGFRVSRIPKSKHRIKSFVKKDASPFDAIVAALLKEKTARGTKMRLAWHRGALTVEKLHRSHDMLALGPMLLEATYARTMRDTFATALSVHATLDGPKKGKKKKAHLVVQSRAAVRRYGYIHAKFSAVDADSIADAIEQAKKHLARLARPQQELTLTVPGSPTLRRGGAVRVSLPDLGLKALVFAKEVRHSVQPGNYTMEVVCGFDDPYVDIPAAESKKKKCDAAHRRNRKAPKGSCDPARRRSDRPKPASHKQRSEKR